MAPDIRGTFSKWQWFLIGLAANVAFLSYLDGGWAYASGGALGSAIGVAIFILICRYVLKGARMGVSKARS
jgi:hypothetical protein